MTQRELHQIWFKKITFLISGFVKTLISRAFHTRFRMISFILLFLVLLVLDIFLFFVTVNSCIKNCFFPENLRGKNVFYL